MQLIIIKRQQERRFENSIDSRFPHKNIAIMEKDNLMKLGMATRKPYFLKSKANWYLISIVSNNIEPKRNLEKNEKNTEETSALGSLGLKPKPAI